MTNQIQGEILFDGWPGTSADGYVYTPWMAVRGDIATFGIEIVVAGGGTVTWDVETRKLEDASATVITSASPVTAAGVHLARNTTAAPCQQLVRYRLKTSATASTAKFVIVRALQPSWQVDRL